MLVFFFLGGGVTDHCLQRTDPYRCPTDPGPQVLQCLFAAHRFALLPTLPHTCAYAQTRKGFPVTVIPVHSPSVKRTRRTRTFNENQKNRTVQ